MRYKIPWSLTEDCYRQIICSLIQNGLLTKIVAVKKIHFKIPLWNSLINGRKKPGIESILIVLYYWLVKHYQNWIVLNTVSIIFRNFRCMLVAMTVDGSYEECSTKENVRRWYLMVSLILFIITDSMQRDCRRKKKKMC